MNKIKIVFLIILLNSCYPNNEKEALFEYKKLIESNTWCEFNTKNKIIFKNGSLKKVQNETLNEIGTYNLSVKESYGAGGWFLPNRYITLKTKDKKYELELKVNSDGHILDFENYKKKLLLILTDDCSLSESDSIFLKVRANYTIINIED